VIFVLPHEQNQTKPQIHLIMDIKLASHSYSNTIHFT